MELFFPKFVLEYEEDLSAGLKDAGVKDLFNFKTNSFSNMIKSSKEEMAITSILQTTKIQVRNYEEYEFISKILDLSFLLD